MSFDKEKVLNQFNLMCQNTLMQTLKIEFIDVGPDFLKAKMPVNSSVHQPMGLLHGGATVALAESVGSAASIMFIDKENEEVRGIEISANHVKSKRSGEVFATAKMIHKGRLVHLWEIKIVDENDTMISLCKLTNIVLPLKK
ncbi:MULTISPECIES: PaaI family thioesterase [Flavobacterium]|nr:PaaI family thioesterase [Flavobacterium sp. N1846]